MRIKTLLNHVWKHKSFVYEEVKFLKAPGGVKSIRVAVRPREHSPARCGGCERAGPT